jgi:hypothetical protein
MKVLKIAVFMFVGSIGNIPSLAYKIAVEYILSEVVPKIV